MDIKQLLLALEDISPALPFLFRLIVVGLAALATWAVVSVLAYWLYQVLAPAIEKALLTLSGWRVALSSLAQRWFSRRGEPVSQFVETHAQSLALNSDNSEIRAAMSATQQAVASLPASVAALDLSLNSARSEVSRGTNSIERMQHPAPLAVPTPEEFVLVQVGANQSLLTTIAFALFSVALVAINTLMLNEFFSTFFPPLRVAGIKLALIGAWLFSVVEFACGAGMAFIDGDDRMATAKRFALGTVIAVLATIEFGLYAKFGQGFGFNPFSDLFAEGSTGATVSAMWFGVFGPAVVFTMAWCGDMLFVGIRGLAQNRAAVQWKSYLRNREKAADTVQARVLSTTNAVEVLKRALNEVNRAFLDTSGDKALAAKINQAREDFLVAVEAAKAMPLAEVKPLGHSDMLRLYITQLFLCFSCLLAIAFIILTYSPLGIGTSFLMSGVDKPSALVAIVECAILLGAGYVSTRTGNHIPVGLKSAGATSWPRWPLLVFVGALVVAILAANAFFIFARFNAIEAMWFAFVTAACLWLFRCGQSIGLMLAAGWALFVCIFIVCFAVAVWGLTIVVGGLALLLMLLNLAALILRFPYTKWLDRKGKGPGSNAAVQAAA